MGASTDIRGLSAEQSNGSLVVSEKAVFKLATTGCQVAKRDGRLCSGAAAQLRTPLQSAPMPATDKGLAPVHTGGACLRQ
ncbi:hypothetical protein XcodCFBP4690_13840 [Xanthomonas codiaei]|uniref:Uncharacterized protein n=1 Tax=Xanthomonas codiaei TaxID=56463 RepID=A0A2S7CLK7_9XANT|nr:hypothetical protein XcodCFBP4690_13840 [Xanthomonas codiaei]